MIKPARCSFLASAAALLAAFLLVVPSLSSAATVTTVLDPSDDASIYTCQGCSGVVDDQALRVDGSAQVVGVVKFETTSFTEPVTQALLSVNPYALPLWDQTLQVYGFESTGGTVQDSDASAGVLLGTWTLPPNLGFGQDAFYDVTAFFQTVTTPYVGFSLQSSGNDVFSSLEFNYGHSSQLTLVVAAPLPSALLLFITGFSGLFGMGLQRGSRGGNRCAARPIR
ncbi:MAG: hypothetical protein L0Y32_04510 [Nevskiales bacterium]|nr:hypothetical protein [Nevskiales bacterium]